MNPAGFRGTVYRAHDPRWAFAPDSGVGAARYGGRFNPPGQPALYVSCSYVGAVTEAQQGMSANKLQPLTLVSYDVDHESILDLSTPDARGAAGISLVELDCPWELLLLEHKVPPSHALAARLIADGVGGILVPSFAPGAAAHTTNIVFWRWTDRPPHQVRVIDDQNRLAIGARISG